MVQPSATGELDCLGVCSFYHSSLSFCCFCYNIEHLIKISFATRLMWKTTPITLLFLVTMMPWLDPPGVLLFDWNWSNTVTIMMSAVLGFLLQWSGALALG